MSVTGDWLEFFERVRLFHDKLASVLREADTLKIEAEIRHHQVTEELKEPDAEIVRLREGLIRGRVIESKAKKAGS